MVEGYDFEPEVGANKYITFKIGKTYKIRIGSTPLHKASYWLQRGKDWIVRDQEDHTDFSGEKPKKREIFVWKAFLLAIIEDKDGKKAWVQSKDVDEVRVLKTSVSIYSDIKELAERVSEPDPEDNWGDPSQYDIKIEVVGEFPDYYKVVPLMGNRGPLSETQKKALDESDIDLSKELEGGKVTKTFGDGKGAEELETVENKEDQINEEDLDKIDKEVAGEKK